MDYQSRRWKKKQQHILKLDNWTDRVMKRYGVTREATTVHHIYPADEFPEYQWDDWNLISVNLGTHNKLENRKTGELSELGKELQRRTRIGIDWRKNGSIKR